MVRKAHLLIGVSPKSNCSRKGSRNGIYILVISKQCKITFQLTFQQFYPLLENLSYCIFWPFLAYKTPCIFNGASLFLGGTILHSTDYCTALCQEAGWRDWPSCVECMTLQLTVIIIICSFTFILKPRLQKALSCVMTQYFLKLKNYTPTSDLPEV